MGNFKGDAKPSFPSIFLKNNLFPLFTQEYVEFPCIMLDRNLLQAPLLIGCDVRNMSKDTKEILTNEEVIAVNQGKYNVRSLIRDLQCAR